MEKKKTCQHRWMWVETVSYRWKEGEAYVDSTGDPGRVEVEPRCELCHVDATEEQREAAFDALGAYETISGLKLVNNASIKRLKRERDLLLKAAKKAEGTIFLASWPDAKKALQEAIAECEGE